MAKKKSRKRGWTGAPAPRPATGTRPAGSTNPSGAATTAAPPAEPSDAPAPVASGTPSGTSTAAAGNSGNAKPNGSVTTTTPAGANRLARKEEARRQREILRRKDARRRAFRRYGTIAAIAVVVICVIALLIVSNKPKSSAHPDPASLPGISTAPAPWPPETAQLQARIDKMGLPPLGTEATDYHIHQNLQVYVHGAPEPVPNGIGNISAAQLAEIHTHTGNGTIHVEAGAQRHYTLGDVFDVWGVLFTKDQLGAYKNNGDNKIRVYVDGKQVTTDPTLIPLKDQEVIVVTYGTAAEVPTTIPSVFCYESTPLPKGQACPPTPGSVTGPSGASGPAGLSGPTGATGGSGPTGASGPSAT
jgi:hypothetical protein